MANRWWQFRDYQPGTMAAIATVPRYTACSRVTKRPVFEFVSRDVHPDNTVIVFPFADDYSFGILQSILHWTWFVARCSTLKGDFRYTSETVFDTFPWPQSPSLAQARLVAHAAVALRELRRRIMAENNWSLRDLYRTLELPGQSPLKAAHEKLNASVRSAYGMKAKDDPLAFLLALNGTLADREASMRPVIGPGLPPSVKEAASFISEDCITL
jgi:hypothetical protein